MLNDATEKRGSNTPGQNPNAGWFNRFVQTGKSEHETKSNGCFGGHARMHRINTCVFHS